MDRNLKSLLAAAVLACTAMFANAAPCKQLTYPKQALRAGEAGLSLIGFLVRPNGTVARSIVLNSSGSADLDRATAEALSTCTFTPLTKDGQPVEAWEQVTYTWLLDDDPDLNRQKRAAAQAAGKGDLEARYQLSMLLQHSAKTDTERERAMMVLRSAADLGNAHAQFEVGRHLEQGLDGQPKDAEAAMPWYRKAAAQGDVFAIQRIERGLLPDATPPAPAAP